MVIFVSSPADEPWLSIWISDFKILETNLELSSEPVDSGGSETKWRCKKMNLFATINLLAGFIRLNQNLEKENLFIKTLDGKKELKPETNKNPQWK